MLMPALSLWLHALAALLFALLPLAALRTGGDALPRRALAAALGLTALAALATAGIGADEIVTHAAGALCTLGWLAFLLLLHRRAGEPRPPLALGTVYGVIGLVTLAALVMDGVAATPGQIADKAASVALLLHMLVAVGALVMVQALHAALAHNAGAGLRWSVAALGGLWLAELAVHTLAYLGVPKMLTYDPLKVYGLLRPVFDNRPDSLVRDNTVTEKVWTAYGMIKLDGDVAGKKLTGSIGVQAVYTDQSSKGSISRFDSATGDVLVVPAAGGDKFWRILASANFALEVANSTYVKLAASLSMVRPRLDQERVNQELNFNFQNIGSSDPTRPFFQSTGGNALLRPYRSANVDLSVEHYFPKGGYVSVAGYYKSIDNFIVQTRSAEPFTIANASNLPIGGGITGPNTATFNVRRPRNAENVSVRGVELNVTHTFDYLPSPLDGLGISANATFVDSSAAFDVTRFDQSVAVEGLGNSYNLTGFYEKDGFAARIAYNRRGRFLEYLVTPGQGGDPVFRRPYSQVDVRVSYDIKKFAQVFAEGTNVTNSRNITTGRFDNQVLDYVDTGARYAAGVRLNF